MKMIYVTKEVIDDICFEDLDIQLKEDYGFDYEDDTDYVEIKVGNPEVDNELINIDSLIIVLQDLKSIGTTHVSLDYHCDHHGYNITGYKVYHSTNEQIEKFESSLKKHLNINSRIKELHEEIDRLKTLKK